MKTIYALICLVLFSTINQAQYKSEFNNISLNQNMRLSRQLSMSRINSYSNSAVNQNISTSNVTNYTYLADTIKYNNYVDKINRYHDPVANPNKASIQGTTDTSLNDTINKTSTPDTINTSLTDTMKYNMYGDLLNDNPLYNERSPWWMVVLRVTLTNVTTNLIDHYIFNYDYSRVGFNSWSHNIKTGWEWDVDRFAMNNFFHPFTG